MNLEIKVLQMRLGGIGQQLRNTNSLDKGFIVRGHESVVPGHGGDFFVSLAAFRVFGEKALVLCCHDFLEIGR